MLSTLVAIDGPLLQKAVTVLNVAYIDPVQLTVLMSPVSSFEYNPYCATNLVSMTAL